MKKWPWMERTFRFDYPVEKFPDILERVRGTPARVEDLVKGHGREKLARRFDEGWSIQENIGHLIDLGHLPLRRIEEILSDQPMLAAADMSNRATHEGNHNAADIGELLRRFRQDRARLVARFEEVNEKDWGKSSVHPRLRQPMRLVDVAYFDAEHDDYHLGRMRELVRLATMGR